MGNLKIDSIEVVTRAVGLDRKRGNTELTIKETRTRTITLFDYMAHPHFTHTSPDVFDWLKSENFDAAFRIEPGFALGVRSVPIHTLSAAEKSRRKEWHGMTHDLFLLNLTTKRFALIDTERACDIIKSFASPNAPENVKDAKVEGINCL